MAKIFKKRNRLEEEYHAIKQEQADRREENLRILGKFAFVSVMIYFTIVVVSVIAGMFSIIFIPMTVSIALILLIAVLVCFYDNVSGYINTDILVSGISGERIATDVLSALPDSYTVFQNVIVPYGEKKSEIDNIVVGKSGVFIIEVKNHNGYIEGNLEDTYWTQHKVGRGGTCYENDMYNPVKQVGTHIYRLANYLRNRGVNTYIEGMVYFVNDACRLSLTGKSTISVFSSYEQEEKNICRHILSGNSNLDDRSVNDICKLLNLLG